MAYDLGKLLSWTCPRCQQTVRPTDTLVKDKSGGFRMRCPTCEPRKGQS